MDKFTFIKELGLLIHLQTYQCYKGKALKGDLKKQRKIIDKLTKELGYKTLSDVEMLALFLDMNCYDIDEKFVCETLKLKS